MFVSFIISSASDLFHFDTIAGRWRKKIKRIRFRRENEKGERKTEENYMKNEGKGLKNASFRDINSKS